MNTDDQLAAVIAAIRREEYQRGLREGISRLESIAAIVPTTWSKQQILRQADESAKVLRRKLQP
jgi:hypothetical protein